MPSIAGQSILIIGGSSGMGFAVAELALAQDVSHVSIASSSQSKVDAAVQRLEALAPSSHGTKVSGHTIDLTSDDVEAQLHKLLADASARGPLDHIITTAGKVDFRAMSDMDLPYLVANARIPVFSNVLIAKLAPAYLSSSSSSPNKSIILTSGAVATRPAPNLAYHSALAASIYALARGLAVELAPRGIRVNCVSPGSTETELWGSSEETRGFYREAAKEKTLTGRAASPEEVAEAYVYLMRNTNATGSVVDSDGGSVIKYQ